MKNIDRIDNLIDIMTSMSSEENNTALHETLQSEKDRVSLMLSQIVLTNALENLIENWEHFYPIDKASIYEFVVEWINAQNKEFDNLEVEEITLRRFDFVSQIKEKIQSAYNENIDKTTAVELYYETSLNQVNELKYALNQFITGVLNAANNALTDVQLMGCPMILHETSLRTALSFSKKVIDKYGSEAPEIAKNIYNELLNIFTKNTL